MAKKKKQVAKNVANENSDPEEDASDTEKARREDERGRTVLAEVGEAIQKGNEIPLEWHPVYKVPCGSKRRTFNTYIGVVVRERVCITYKNWKAVPKDLKDQLYELITKGFTMIEKRKKWVLTRAASRWRAFKTRLRKYWLYRKNGNIRKTPPWKYAWISQTIWDQFIKLCTDDKFKEISQKNQERSKLKNTSYRGGPRGYVYFEEEIRKEFEKQGIHVKAVPRYLTWLRAHSRKENGNMIFDNPIDLEIAKSIKSLEAQCNSGEVVIEGRRDDILSRALRKDDQGGHVYAVGSGVTMREYFGSNNPTPPSQMRAELTAMQRKMEVMQNTQNLMMSYLTTTLNKDQMSQLMANVTNGQLGGFSDQLNSNGFRTNLDCNQGLNGAKDNNSTSLGNEGVLFTELLMRGINGSSQLDECVITTNVPSNPDIHQREDIEPFHVPWPETEQLNHKQDDFDSSARDNIPFTINPSLLQEHTFPLGWSECCMALDLELTGIVVVALGRVYIEAETETIMMTDGNLPQHHRRVQIIEDIEPTAPLPCREADMLYVCEALGTYVAWPSHLIFPRNKYEKQPKKQANTNTPPLVSSSQASTTKKYPMTPKDRAKLTTPLLIAFKAEAMRMKKSNDIFKIEIPESVYYNKQQVILDYADMLDWCFQKEVGTSHISIFMKKMSEQCEADSVSGMFGFCDPSYLSPMTPTTSLEDRSDYLSRVFACNNFKNMNQLFFAPYHENLHWMLAVISPWNGLVFWLDPVGVDSEIRNFAKEIINEGIRKFSRSRKDKKIIRNPTIAWKKPQCPCQPQGTVDCGYYVCRYIQEIVERRRQVIPEKYFDGGVKTYSQEQIDKIRDLLITYILEEKAINDDQEEEFDGTKEDQEEVA